MTGPHHHGAAAVSAEAPRQVPAWRLLLTLALAGGASGALVVMVYRITLPAVQRYAGQQVESAVREVLKAPARWDTLYLVGGKLVAAAPAGSDRRELPQAFVGRNANGARIGVAVTAKEPGFQEELSLMIGFDPANGALTGIKVLEEKETPGLGDKIETDSGFGAQFRGRIPPLHGVKGRSPAAPDEVQTITGATISSRAVIRIVNNALARWRPLLLAYDRTAPP
ncbi:MAG TPA: FMN-binding protein [Gemmatimonadales bacterium]|nr:FMN-binding protein [Gemmatimonadales bacterium]